MEKLLKAGVTIKGTKEGLLFFLDDTRPFDEVMVELSDKLTNQSHAHMWDGPLMNVIIKLGKRRITAVEENEIRTIFTSHENLVIHAFESEDMPYLLELTPSLQVRSGTVRSGQVLTHQGDLLFMGDINPGGAIHSTGSIYVMGALRGLAHAGSNGDVSSIIAASLLRPTQLRIADTISRPPDQWNDKDIGMRFAFLEKKQIMVERMSYLSRIRPEKDWKENGHLHR
ncbi:septum site-determining protein MinC [Hazenella sp. IB182353]|uniref:septum site-determining protein MinC n=1 Tax=Polycladospora coralii TaxID=2771432 RepID=UPI001746A5F2|nr:septum site-determining protein MinC [Polycladospora coralii]MBS7529238.1 septum site-determining protein MinC [Polycladospora coralii]